MAPDKVADGSESAQGNSAASAVVSPLNKQLSSRKSHHNEVSLSAMALLLGESVRYAQERVRTPGEGQNSMAGMGFAIGARYYELLCFREKHGKREIKMMDVFRFVGQVLMKALLGRPADSLEVTDGRDDEYRFVFEQPLNICKWVSVPLDRQDSPPSVAFVSGIVEGALDAADMVSLF